MAHGSVVHAGLHRLSWLQEGAILLSASAILALAAKVQVPGPIPFTMQTFVVMLFAGAMGGYRAAAAVLLYLMEGAAGIPVFAGPVAGFAYFAGPTTGYLVGFAIAALLIGSWVSRSNTRSFAALVTAYLVGHLIILTAGLTWLFPSMGFAGAMATGVVPFLVTAILKSALAAIATPAARRGLERLAG